MSHPEPEQCEHAPAGTSPLVGPNPDQPYGAEGQALRWYTDEVAGVRERSDRQDAGRAAVAALPARPRLASGLTTAIARPGTVERRDDRSGEAAGESDEEVQPVKGVSPQHDLTVDNVEPAVHPDALLDRSQDEFVGPFGEDSLAVRRDRVKVHPEAAMPPLERRTEEALDPGTAPDCRQRDVDVQDIVCQERQRPIEFPSL